MIGMNASDHDFPARDDPMSEPLDALAAGDRTEPPRPAPPPPPPARAARGCGFSGCLLGVSLLLNVIAITAVVLYCGGSFIRSAEDDLYPETHAFGDRKADDKVAIVSIDGILLEGL